MNLQNRNKKLITWIAISGLIIIVLFPFFVNPGQSMVSKFVNAILAVFISNNIAGFILGLPFGIIKFKNLPYNKRYFNASLISILVINAFLAVGTIIASIINMIKMI
ncbi:MAG: hypothetical protein C0592_13430 [Marinilabiliales bacterium]|nr:MAG: hypothetical protein C0592_13430 [Marinilabiliales bacterium]